MPPVGFEPTISGGERPQTYALDRAAPGTGVMSNYRRQIVRIFLTDPKSSSLYDESLW